MDEETEQYDYLTANGGLNWQAFNEYGFVSPWAPRLWKASVWANYLVSGFVAFAVVVTFGLLSGRCRHWCLIPMLVCGIFAGSDIIAWLRKEIDTFDPKVLVAVYLYNNCFIAPMVHLSSNLYGMSIHTPDWPTWFGYMALFNAFGIMLFKWTQNVSFKQVRPVKSFWEMEPAKFSGMLIPILVISLAASLIIRIVFGGLIRGGLATEGHPVLSVLRMLGDPLPMLVTMAIIYWIYKKRPLERRSFLLVAFIIALTMVFQLLWVGQRGSRGGILGAVVIITAIVHYRLRALTPKVLLTGACLIFLFAHLYTFYKHLGPIGWRAFYSAEARKSLSYELGGATFRTTLVGDLARADLQAMMLYHLIEDVVPYQPVYGKTYMWAAFKIIPRAIWKTKPISYKGMVGSKLQGLGLYHYSSRQYGLAGEAMLNFSYWGIVPAFLVFGVILGWFRKKIATSEPSDSRFFLIPILIVTCMMVVPNDANVLMFGLLRKGVLPFIIVFFGANRYNFASESDYI